MDYVKTLLGSILSIIIIRVYSSGSSYMFYYTVLCRASSHPVSSAHGCSAVLVKLVGLSVVVVR